MIKWFWDQDKKCILRGTTISFTAVIKHYTVMILCNNQNTSGTKMCTCSLITLSQQTAVSMISYYFYFYQNLKLRGRSRHFHKGGRFFSFRKSDFKKCILRKIKWYQSIIQTEDYNYNLAQKRIRLCNCLQQVEDYFKLF
jgi:hypothetical protein